MPSVGAAPPGDLFFSEYIEGSSNNKALEIYNGTGGAIDLAAGQYAVQMYFNGSTTAALTINLTGSVASGDVFVLAQASASAPIQAQADQTNGSGWFNGDDAVVLVKAGVVIDAIGQIGVDPGTEWGTALQSTADNTLRRRSDDCVGDANATDIFDPAGPESGWDGFAQDTFDGLGSHVAACDGVADAAPFVVSTLPVSGATAFPAGSNLTVTFSEPVQVVASAFALICNGSNVAMTVSGGPTVFTLDPQGDLPAGAACLLTIDAAGVADVDTIDPPDGLANTVDVTFTTVDLCAAPATHLIPAIQGAGLAAAVTGPVVVRGVVVGDFETAGSGLTALGGFYLQDAQGDGDPATSDGIFVYTGGADTVTAGEQVVVSGYARERFNQTTINGANSNATPVPASAIARCGLGSVVPTPVTLPFDTLDSPERFEGMLVTLPQPLVIAEYFNYDRFGEIVLALPLDGEARPFVPTALETPGPAATARAAANRLRRITLDDGLGNQNPEFLRHPNGTAFGIGNQFRGGDIVQNVVGVLGFDFSLYRIQPTGPAIHTASNPRPTAPEVPEGSLRLAAMNTLNFFLTPDYPSGSPLDNRCGPLQNLECRGADADQPQEFIRQRTKLVAAIAGLNPDVVGLNEIENTTGVDPLADPEGLVAGLNAQFGAGAYAAVSTGVIGTDAIRVGLIFKPARVRPVGPFSVLTSSVDPRFLDTKNRPVLAQTFEDLTTGGRFTVAVAHLKSKGSNCNDVGDPDMNDGQGNCNQTRRAAAQAVVEWLSTDPTGSGDRDVIILGDLNAYAMEDPVTAIRNGRDGVGGTVDDFTNLIASHQGRFAYSYVFDGEAGYLDHALASATLSRQTLTATEWHINADEPDVIDYDTSFKGPLQQALFEPNAFRASDHDVMLVALEPDHYGFRGFDRVHTNVPTLNVDVAGRALPLRFDLPGVVRPRRPFGAVPDVLAEGFPISRPITCGTGELLGPDVAADYPGRRELWRRLFGRGYLFLWKTERAWSGTCRQLVFTFNDGSVHYANFRFR